MATNTAVNIGIRRDIPALGEERNFESSGVLYISNRENLEFLGTEYDVGSDLPYDVGGVSYSSDANDVLELYWNQGWCNPKT